MDFLKISLKVLKFLWSSVPKKCAKEEFLWSSVPKKCAKEEQIWHNKDSLPQTQATLHKN